jgi:hypothetical protein
MFLGQKDVVRLNLFLSGILFAEDYHEIPTQNRIRGFDFAKFEKWVESEFNHQRLSHNSLSLAKHLAESDATGFDLWFAWYDEYRESGLAAQNED